VTLKNQKSPGIRTGSVAGALIMGRMQGITDVNSSGCAALATIGTQVLTNFGDCRNDARLVAGRKFRITRQCQDITRGGLSLGELTHSITQVFEAFLQMQRFRIIDSATNFARLQLAHQ
jgi:hypothetical protein